MLPWSALAPCLDWRAVRFEAAHRFCLIAALVVFVFFSLARAKLLPYVMPVFPPLAVLIGDAISRTIESRPWRLAVAAPILGIIGAAAAAVAFFAPDFASLYIVQARPAFKAVAIVGLSGGVLASAALWTRRAGGQFEFGMLAFSTAVALMAGSYGRLAVEPMRSYAKLCATVAAAAPDARLICFRRYVQALPFYARRRVILVGAKTELGFGAAHSPDADRWFFNGRQALLQLWRAPGPAVVLIDTPDLGRLQSSLAPYTVIGSEWKKSAIRKPTDAAAGH
jgi:4-amino-4-deoxy-L-arabinose transferase-like glycosyltransferase